MAKNYTSVLAPSARQLNKGPTAQTVKARADQVKNNAGGYVFKLDDWKRLNRFLVLGSEGTFYQSGQKMTKDNAKNVLDLIERDGKRVVDTVVQISEEGRAPKNDPALFVLALASTYGSDLKYPTDKEDDRYFVKIQKFNAAKEVREYALRSLPRVARIGTHLFTFVAYADSLRGWGKGMQKAVARWYNEMDASKLALQVCKYASRSLEGEAAWNHRDLLRKSHLTSNDSKHQTIYKYVTEGRELRKVEWKDKATGHIRSKMVGFTPAQWEELKNDADLKYLWAHEKAKAAKTSEDVVPLIEKFRLTHESIPTEVKNSKVVYDALLPKMPLEAMIRNLGTMTKVGTISSDGVASPLGGKIVRGVNEGAQLVVQKLSDVEQLKRARIHPFNVLTAYKTYSQGHGFKGGNSWTPVQVVKDALNQTFYDSFKYVEPTGKRYMLGIDVSGSMSMGNVCGSEVLTPAEGAAAMAMAIARTEPKYYMMGFAHEFRDLGITANDSLETVLRKTSINNFGGTNAALPMEYALKNKIAVDVFVVITDNDTWSGNSHPYQALNKYRSQMNIPDAKLVVIGMTATKFSIADPNDPGMLDLAGFDSAGPQIIAEFARGKV